MPKPMITDVSIDYLPASRIQFPVSADRPAGFEGKNPLEFAPIAHQVEYGGKQIYLSKLYQYRDDYPVVFAYVDDGQQLRPALLYYSKSHAIWRVAPATKGKFAKAHGEFSCDLPPLLNIAMMKKFNPAIEAQQYNQMQGKITDFVNAFTAPIVGHLEASPAFVAETVGPENAEKIFHLNGSAIIYNLIKSEALDQIDSAIHEREDLPDFAAITDDLQIPNSFYNRHLMQGDLHIFACASFNGKYQYLFAEGTPQNSDKSIRFLLTVALSSAPLNHFCVAAQSAYLGYGHITPIMRPEYRLKATHCDSIVFIHPSTKEIYCDVSTYALQLPINVFANHPEQTARLREAPANSGNPAHEAQYLEEQDEKLLDLISQISTKLRNPSTNKAECLKQLMNFLHEIQTLKDLAKFLITIEQQNGLAPLWAEKGIFINTSGKKSEHWSQLIMAIKEKTWDIVRTKGNDITSTEIILAMNLFDEKRGALQRKVTASHKQFQEYLSTLTIPSIIQLK